MSSHQIASSSTEMFRPPVNRSMRLLDRTFFQKRVPLAAATVLDKKQISPYRSSLHDDLLHLGGTPNVVSDPRAGNSENGLKALLLKPEVRHDGTY